MNPEDDEIEQDDYVPEAVGLADGEFMIFDPLDFEMEFDCYAVTVRGNCLFVLCKQSRIWVPAEGRGSGPAKPSKLRTVQ